MRKIALVLVYFSCLGHGRQVQASAKQGDRLADVQTSMQNSRSRSLAFHESALHPLRVLATLLVANRPFAAFKALNLGSFAAGAASKQGRVYASPCLQMATGLMTCELCGASYEVEDSLAGQQVQCGVCKAIIEVPPLVDPPEDKKLVDYPEDVIQRYANAKRTEGFEVVVRNLNLKIQKDDVFNHFSKCGPVVSVHMPTDQYGRPRLLANVIMKRWVDGVMAVEALDGGDLLGQKLRVEEGDHYSKRVEREIGLSSPSGAASKGSGAKPVQSFRNRNPNQVQSFRGRSAATPAIKKDWKHKGAKKLTEFKVGQFVVGTVTNVIEKATFVDFGAETDGVMPREATPNSVPKKNDQFKDLVIAKIDLEKNRAVLLPKSALPKGR